MAITGWNFAITGATTVLAPFDGGGAVDWSYPTRIVANDGSYTTTFNNNLSFTRGLQATNFGWGTGDFAAAATITGIEFRCRIKADSGETWQYVRVLKAGTISGYTGNDGGGAWASSETAVIVGSTTDLWDTTWTGADLHSTTFGVAFSSDGGVDFSANWVDSVESRVSYSAGFDPEIQPPVTCGVVDSNIQIAGLQSNTLNPMVPMDRHKHLLVPTKRHFLMAA